MKKLKEIFAILFWAVLFIIIVLTSIAQVGTYIKGPYTVEYEAGKHMWIRHMASGLMFVTHHPDCPCKK